MKLNLPILDRLADAQNILIAGAGGGFDVFNGLPIYFTLRDLGKNVHLANYTFCELDLVCRMAHTETLLEHTLVGATGSVGRVLPYYPEGYLAQWFKEVRGEEVTVWMFAKTGAAPLLEAYQCLVAHLGIDAILLVDGGVDSLMRGDEPAPGTLVEDAISLCAVQQVDVPVKLLAAVGFGTEVEEGVNHYHALENIAALAREGAFFGSCSLTPQMPAFQLYEQAARYVWEQAHHQRSHIGVRVIPAVRGEFGNYHMYPQDHEARTPVLISPLLGIYWFFDAHIVSQRSFLTEALRGTTTTNQAFTIYMLLRRELSLRRDRKLTY